MSNRLQTAQLRELDALHHLHPFTDHSSLRASGARVIVRGDGAYIWDSEGNRILDGMAGFGRAMSAMGAKSSPRSPTSRCSSCPITIRSSRRRIPPVVVAVAEARRDRTRQSQPSLLWLVGI